MEAAERAFGLLNAALFLGILTVTAAGYQSLVRPFLRGVSRTWLVGGAYFALMLYLYLTPTPYSNLQAYSLGAAAGFFVMYLLDRSRVRQKLFLAVTFFSLRWLSRDAVSRLIMILEACFEPAPRYPGDWFPSFLFFSATALMELVLYFLLLIPSLSGVLSYAVWQAFYLVQHCLINGE